MFVLVWLLRRGTQMLPSDLCAIVQLVSFLLSFVSFFISFDSFYFGIPHDRRLKLGCFEIDLCFVFVIFNLFISLIFLLWG